MGGDIRKIATAWYTDGRVSAVVGTHTHIPTADERILPKGTAYITDVGMTGSYNSVIGMDLELAIERFKTTMRKPYKIAEDNVKLLAVLISINDETGQADSIQRISLDFMTRNNGEPVNRVHTGITHGFRIDAGYSAVSGRAL